jgi:hypothetical protein
MGLERYLQDWVRELNAGPVGDLPEERLTLVDRLKIGAEQVREIVGKVWIWVLVGIGIGAAIHGYVPEEMMLRIMGGEAWWSVPAAVVVGVPMYTNAAGVIPIVEALLGKGAALGTTLAFMMSVIALSPARDDHPQAGADLAPDRDLPRRRRGGHPRHRLSLQRHPLKGPRAGRRHP